jgi:predicted ATPase
MENFVNKYIISGGPGSGKTTLINALAESGYACSPEVSRRLIIEEVSRHSDCLPWKDISCFSGRVLTEMIIAWKNSSSALTFFDRGIPDIIAYLKIAGLPVPGKYNLALKDHPYQNQVFILPPWKQIYITDTERWQSFEEASAIYDCIKDTYRSFAFELIELPKVPLADRLKFILSFVNK